MTRGFAAIGLLLFLLPNIVLAEGGRFSTYLEGTLIRKSADEWVLATDEGTYWIYIRPRPVSWKRNHAGGKISFWVPIEQIRKVRPPLLRGPVIETGRETAIAGLDP